MPTLLEKNKAKYVEYGSGTLIDVPSVESPTINFIIAHIERTYRRFDHIYDRFLVLQAKTASGKSTILPSTLYQHFDNITLACTEPRVATAISIPNDIVKYPFKKPLILGRTIGYQTGNVKNVPIRGVIFMTLGVLSQQFKTMTDDEISHKYNFIIIDEAHERSVDFDILFLMIKLFLLRNYNKPSCPYFIFMSATFDPTQYCDYLVAGEIADESHLMNVGSNGSSKVYKNIIYVSGFNYDITPHFLDTDTNDYLGSAFDTCVKIHSFEDDFKSPMRDVIVFIVNGKAILELKERLDEYNKSCKFKFKTIIYDRENVNRQNVAEVDYPIESLTVDIDGVSHAVHRRIILATTVAETGLTVDTLRYVIDSGWCISKEFYPEWNCGAFLAKPIFRSMGEQRRGRSGRKGPGEWYPLFTEATWNGLIQDQLPEIVTNDVAYTILYILYITATQSDVDGVMMREYDMKNIYGLFSCPSFDAIHYSMEKLYALGYIDERYVTSLSTMLFSTTISSLEWFRAIVAGLIHNINILDLATCYAYYAVAIGTTSTEVTDERMSMLNDDFAYPLLYMRHIDTLDKLDDDAMLFVDQQQSTLSELIALKLNVYNGLIFDECVDDMIINYTIGFKKCIYEGFKLNSVSVHGETYISDQRHIEVAIKSELVKVKRPKRLIVRSIDLMKGKNGYIYSSDVISVVDGYYAIDQSLV